MEPPKISSAKLEVLAARQRLDLDLAVGELAASAGLLLVPAVAVGRLEDRLAVGDLRRVQEDVDVEAVLELGDGDLDVELAVAGEQVLVALGVAPGVEGEVLVHQPVQGVADLLLVPLRLRLDGERHRRLGDADPAEHDRHVLGAQGVAGDGDLELGDAADVAGDQARHVRPLLALDGDQVAEPLGLLGAAVPDVGVGVERAGDDAQQRDLAGEGVGEGLEDQHRERPGGIAGER